MKLHYLKQQIKSNIKNRHDELNETVKRMQKSFTLAMEKLLIKNRFDLKKKKKWMIC